MVVLKFDPAARLQRYLGRELIADPNLAIVEFVKNSWDAGASEVIIDFKVRGAVEDHEIVISDNGVGMSVNGFVANWMRPGYSYKAAGREGTTRRNEAARRMANRIPSGEKGLGRLAAGRLGELLDVYTRESPTDPWFRARFDWKRFDDLDHSLGEIEIEGELGVPPPVARFATGTVVRIAEMRFNWSQRVRGRREQDRAETRIGRLREDLALLLEPFAPAGRKFQVVIAIDDPALQDRLAGPIELEQVALRDYIWKFSMTPAPDGNGVIVRRTISRSKRLQEVGLPPRSEQRRRRRTAVLRCGPLSGTFYYSPPRIAVRNETLGRPPGVYLYRDGIRVEPYGSPEDDWLGVQARKASRQGWSAIQPKLLTGFVEISKRDNPLLIDMSNRSGLVEVEAYEDLVAQLRLEFRELDKVVLDEVVKPGWTKPEARAQEAAKRAQSFATALTRQVAHSVRTPVSSLGAEVLTIETVAKQLTDGKAKKELLAASKRARGHLDEIDLALSRLMAVSAENLGKSIKDVSVAEVVRDAVQRCQARAELKDVAVAVEPFDDVNVQTDNVAVTEAVVELITNAIDATRANLVSGGTVRVTVSRTDFAVEIRVVDQGSGVRDDVLEKLFETSVSTKGRPGFGLVHTSTLLALVNAEVRVDVTGSSGSTFVVMLPNAAATRREVQR